MKVLSLIDKHLEEVLCAVILSLMTIVIFLQVVLRTMHLPLYWTEEIGRYLFIWLISIGCASAVRKRKHICVELLDLVLKERGRFVLSIISNIVFLVFAIVLAYYSVAVVQRVSSQLSPAVRMPMSIPYSSVLVGSVLMVFRLVQDTIARFKEREEALTAND